MQSAATVPGIALTRRRFQLGQSSALKFCVLRTENKPASIKFSFAIGVGGSVQSAGHFSDAHHSLVSTTLTFHVQAFDEVQSWGPARCLETTTSNT